METKHTKEFAERLAKEKWSHEFDQAAFLDGYMTAIEETAAPEILEALGMIIIKATTAAPMTKGERLQQIEDIARKAILLTK